MKSITSAPLIPDEDLLGACTDLVQRVGAKSFQVRYSDDLQPVVWMAVAEFTGVPHQVAAALSPGRAAYRLVEQLVDGGRCQHCGKPSGITDDFTATMPMGRHVCWYQYDPELRKFRRGCEGGRP